MDLNKWEKTTNIIVAVMTTMAILSGGIFGLIEYLDFKRETKINKTLHLVNKYNDGKLLESQQKLDKAWDIAYPVLLEILSEDKSKEAYEGFVIALIKNMDLNKYLNLQMSFYDETVSCIEESICHKTTMHRYFYKKGKVFFRKFYPYICELRGKWNDPSIWLNAQRYYSQESIGRICS